MTVGDLITSIIVGVGWIGLFISHEQLLRGRRPRECRKFEKLAEVVANVFSREIGKRG
jgi:hypothetical protein